MSYRRFTAIQLASYFSPYSMYGLRCPGGGARGHMTPGTHTKSEVAVPGVNPGWYLHCLWWSLGGLRAPPSPGFLHLTHMSTGTYQVYLV